MGGANDGDYGYPKRAFYALQAVYRPVCAWLGRSRDGKFTLTPTLYGMAATKRYGLTVTVQDAAGKRCVQRHWESGGGAGITQAPAFHLLPETGGYDSAGLELEALM